MPKKIRLDQLLVDRGLAPTKTKAQSLIMAGLVYSSEQRLEKPGIKVDANLALQIKEGRRWVGRGAYKLQKALDAFDVVAQDRSAIDVGSSTGGFTQVFLESGASRVIALDVGKGQLDWSLRKNPRVHVLEGINARYLQPSDLPFQPNLASFDVSFISLKLVIPPILACLSAPWDTICLVKPQFEVGREQVGKKGIVKSPELHVEVLHHMADYLEGLGYPPHGITSSPLLGASGNREFLMHFSSERPEPYNALTQEQLFELVRQPIERMSS